MRLDRLLRQRHLRLVVTPFAKSGLHCGDNASTDISDVAYVILLFKRAGSIAA